MALIGVIGLFGWLIEERLLASVRISYIPMAIDTAFCFIFLALILLGQHFLPLPRHFTLPSRFLLILIALYGLLKLLEAILKVDLTFAEAFFPVREHLGEIPIGRMSPIVGGLFFLSGMVLLLSWVETMSVRRINSISIMALGVAATGFFFTLAYLFGAPVLYNSGIVPPALVTSIGFLFLGSAIIAKYSGDSAMLVPFRGSSPKAMMLRYFVPLIIFGVLFHELVVEGATMAFGGNPAVSSVLAILIYATLITFAVFVVSKVISHSIEEAHAARAATESLFHEAQHMAKLGNWEVDIATNYTTGSPELKAIFAIESDCDFSLNEMIHSQVSNEDWEHLLQVQAHAIRSGDGFKITIPITNPDGRKKYVEVIGKCDLDNSGNPSKLKGTIQDITEEKLTEAALKESEERFRTLFENATVGLYRTTPDGQIVLVNKAMLNMMGFENLEEHSKRMAPNRGYVNAADAEEFLRRMDSVGEVIDFETAWMRKDGSTVFVRESARAVRDTFGVILFYEGTVEDITERQRAIEALKDSEENYRVLVENAFDAVYLLRGHHYEYVNPAFSHITRYSREELLSPDFDINCLLPFESHEIIQKRFEARVRGDNLPSHYILRILTKNAELRDLEVNTVSIGKDGEVAVIGFMRDVTEKKQIEDALRLRESQMQGAAFMARLGPWEYDALNDIFTFNDAFYAIFRTTSAEVGSYQLSSSEYATRFVHPEDAHIVGLEVQKALETNDPNYNGKIDHRILYSDGSIGYISVRFFIVKDKNGRTIKTYGVNQDITERVQAEADLRESEERFRKLSQMATEGVFIHRNGIILESNLAAVKLFGFDSSSDVIGKNGVDIISFTDESKARIRRHLERNSDEIYQVEILRKDGSISYMETHGRDIEWNGVPARLTFLRDITERVIADRALRESEERNRVVFENAGDYVLMFEFDKNGAPIIIDTNEMTARIHGFARRDLIGKPISMIDPDMEPEEQERRKSQVEKDISEHGFSILPVRHRKWDGTYFDVEARIQPIVLGGREVFLSIERDFTERKRIENALKESEENYRNVIEGISEAIFSMDLKGYFTFANQTTEKITGYDLEELKLMTYLDLVQTDFRAHVKRHYMRQFTSRKRQTAIEFPLVTKSGNVIWIGQSATLAFNGDKIIGFNLVSRDITERKLIESALIASEEKFRAIFDNARDAIFARMIDPNVETNFLEVNNAACLLTGYTESELTNMKPTDIEDQSTSGTIATRQNLLLNDKIDAFEVNFKAKNGSLIPVEITSHIFDYRGQPTLVSIVRDLRLRKGLEEQIRQSQKMEAVGRLAGGVAHDFNNLLTVIQGHSEIVLNLIDAEDPIHENVNEIALAAARASNLTRQLLAFSRKQALSLKVLDLNNILNEMSKMLKRIIGEDISLESTNYPDLWKVKVDAGQIEQVIVNLSVNARDAMPSGGMLSIETANVTLDEGYVRNHPGSTKGPHVMLAISDNGTGMTAEVKNKIFEPFFTTKEIGKGTGLGLSTVFGIVKQSGGSINVYSELGVGTTFKIYLPKTDDQLEPVTERTTKHPEMPRGSETILLVEDDDAVRRITLKFLDILGYKTLYASSGPDALKMIDGNNYSINLLLTDVVMPGMNGDVLAKILKERIPGLRVLYMSGYTAQAIVHDGILDPGTPYLSKPFRPQELALKLREVLDT